jgi:quercetin dioxygenase-like cupin family protein
VSSKVVKHHDGSWQGVERLAYKAEGRDFRGVSRHTLVDIADVAFVTRYFEIEAGGYSSLEKHEHAHVVVVLKGRGQVVLGAQVHELRPFDVVYVASQTLHQFMAAAGEPLGFVCVVDRERDRPQPPSDAEIDELLSDPVVAGVVKRRG